MKTFSIFSQHTWQFALGRQIDVTEHVRRKTRQNEIESEVNFMCLQDKDRMRKDFSRFSLSLIK